MKKLCLMLSAVLAMAAVSCSSSAKESKEEKAQESAEQVEIVEQTLPEDSYWRLTDYVSTEGSINEVPQDVLCVLHFTQEHTFGFSTDCNSLGGQYTTMGDSIAFGDIAWTEMACPSMVIEDAVKGILPRVDTYAINPDTILRLRSDMRIMATLVKTSKEEIKAFPEKKPLRSCH